MQAVSPRLGVGSSTHEYTIHRNGTFDRKCLVKKIVVVCSRTNRASERLFKGETACALPVGSFYPAGTVRLASWKSV